MAQRTLRQVKFVKTSIIYILNSILVIKLTAKYNDKVNCLTIHKNVHLMG